MLSQHLLLVANLVKPGTPHLCFLASRASVLASIHRWGIEAEP